MQAKQRRELHFKSKVGSMLNENYGYGLTQNTVQHGDFVHIPPNSLPITDKAIEFLDKKFFPPPKPQRVVGSGSNTTSGLNQAYRNVTGQPVGMVHYDRDPFFWPGKEKPPSNSENEPVKRNSINCFDYLFNAGRDISLPTPDTSTNSRHSAVSTPTIRSKQGTPSILSSGKERKQSASSIGLNNYYHGDKNKQNKLLHNNGGGRLSSSSSEIPHAVRFAFLSEDKLLDKDGFKAYSPFTDTAPDYDVVLARQNINNVKQPEEKDNSTPVPAPKYSEALNNVLDVTSADANRLAKYSQRRPADVLKLHGNPEYPSKVMEEQDVDNYVAWAKIYPYCPLTQTEGNEKPQFVPPRGFTPSTPSRPPTQLKLRDLKKAKRNIMEGIKLLSSSSSRKRQQQQQQQQNIKNKPILRNANAVNQEGKTNVDMKKQSLLANGNINTQHYTNESTHYTACSNSNNHAKEEDADDATVSAIDHIYRCSRVSRDTSPTHQACRSIMFDPTATRKVLDLKIRSGGDVWYSGKTPTRTPSPDSRLPLPANRAWIKHYSPARVQRFMAGVAKPNALA